LQITLYQRTFPVKDAPVSVSLVPFAVHQRHTFPVGGKVYEAEFSELRVVVPDGAAIDQIRNLLSWDGEKGKVKSTAKEVFDLAHANGSGFRMA
jgi:hypothetical protein